MSDKVYSLALVVEHIQNKTGDVFPLAVGSSERLFMNFVAVLHRTFLSSAPDAPIARYRLFMTVDEYKSFLDKVQEVLPEYHSALSVFPSPGTGIEEYVYSFQVYPVDEKELLNETEQS